MRIKNLIKNEKGFSILSALVAFMILGLALIALLNLMITSAVSGNYALRDSRANYLIESKLEELKTIGYKQLSELVQSNGGKYTGTDVIDSVYSIYWEVKQSDLQSNSLRLMVQVTYPAPNGNVRSIARVTLKSDYD